MGITLTMVHILSNPNSCSLSPVGTILADGDYFGVVAGLKLTSDLTTPVSGTIIEINSLAVGSVGQDYELTPLLDPYNAGWLVVLQLSNPSELQSLMTAQQYAALVANLEE